MTDELDTSAPSEVDWLVRVEPRFEAKRIGVFGWCAYWSNSAISPPNPALGPSFGLRLRMFAGIHRSRRKALRAAEAAWREYFDQAEERERSHDL